MGEAKVNYSLGAYEGAVFHTLKSLQQDRIIQRIWGLDYTVWKSKPDNIVNRLGWLNVPADTLKQLSYLSAVLDPVIAEGYKNAVLLGMGGSSLAAEVFARMFGSRNGHPKLHILDTIDPLAILRIAHELNLDETLFLISSKSGKTLETDYLFHYFYNLALKKLGKQACRNFIIITDPDSPLEELANRLSLRHIFLNNPAIGGRYSALSFPGIVPAALLGIDVEKLLRNALSCAVKEEAVNFNGKLNSTGSVLGAVLGTLAGKGRNRLTFIFPPSWAPFGGWLEQLIAESTGKEGKGILPVCGEPLNVPAAYNNDRLFVIFQNKGKASSLKLSAIIDAGHPVITVTINDKFQLGGQMFCWEMATAVASHILGINPFDQPNVEATKIITRRVIALYRDKKELPQETPSLTTVECRAYGCPNAPTPGVALTDFLDQMTDGAYVCLHVYLNKTRETDAALFKLRRAINRKYRLAVTIGYGPGYLHSTGQLHKGDAGCGLFIQLTSGDLQDIEIPDRLGASGSTLTFGTLKAAQALGDRQALIGLDRRIIRFHLEKNIIANIEALASAVQEGGKRGRGQ
ncbi:MAG: glucose-6-phosphate isomerase [Smithellaceae bacterium]